MKDNIPAPTAKLKKKGIKPVAFGDKFVRCLIASIASYELRKYGKIDINQKSGDTITLDFEVDYLGEIAFAELDSYFKTNLPMAKACDVCANKNRVDPEEADGPLKRTFCDFCYAEKSHFAPPGEVKDE